ncbi:hypothetical protein PROFUN_10811 [Planoprotostelium fungivorum]|uniref:Cytoplasmic dynein 2 heavy chain 1 n=1 Tax=Planoprotostelium fungivorum TaxID=1890364 RepID=A0A2P6NCM1_9EUKA|nr:hypothetical protein PROFUN_10811 [Planoprotostelium fungivorum]
MPVAGKSAIFAVFFWSGINNGLETLSPVADFLHFVLQYAKISILSQSNATSMSIPSILSRSILSKGNTTTVHLAGGTFLSFCSLLPRITIDITVEPTSGANLTGLFLSIKSIKEEYDYWNALSSKYDLSPDVIDRAALFAERLAPAANKLSDINDKSFSDVLDGLESAQNGLDDIWRSTSYAVYPEPRMQFLFNIISESLFHFLQTRLAGVGFWTESFNEVRDTLKKAQQVSEKWVKTVENLMNYWSSYPAHPWNSRKFESASVSTLADLSNRFEEILTARTVQNQLLSLLGPNDSKELRVDNVFSPFSSLDSLSVGAAGNTAWKNASKGYEKVMVPIEQRVAGKLRKIFAGLGDSTVQLLREYQRYKELVQQPTISKELSQEREVFLGQLLNYVDAVRDDFENRSKGVSGAKSTQNEQPLMGKNLPEVVNNIVWVKQILAKTEHLHKSVKPILGDLQRMSKFESSATSLVEELKVYQKEQFSFWVSDMDRAFDNTEDPVILEMTGRLMEIDIERNGQMRVNFSERLITLLREVRQLTALGFKIPPKIKNVAENAQKFHRHGIVLKQVANFYNTVFHQIIPCQAPILLEHAIAFEQVIKQQPKKQVTWNSSPAEVESYIEMLKQAAEKITSENRKLRKYHSIIGDRVVQLMNIDLLKHEAKWKEGVREIRTIFDSLKNQGYKNMTMWLEHWDHQLYKALEYQYKLGLESLHEHTSEFNVELVYKQQQLQFRPSFEDIRAKYYGVMKKFIKFPSTFTGVGDSDIFKEMADRNPLSLIVVYKKAEELFKRLMEEQEIFREWVALGSVNIDAYVEENLRNVADWELNFKMLKLRGREAEKLPTEKKMDCINLSFSPVKSSIDDLIQRLTDALFASIRKSIQKNVVEVEDWTAQAVEKLAKRPTNVEEITHANETYKNLQSEKPTYQEVYDSAESKNNFLKSVAGAGMNLGTLQSKWEQFHISMEYHEVMVSEQVEAIKTGIEGRISNFNGEFIKFSARWSELKPNKVAIQDTSAALATLHMLRDIKSEFMELKTVADTINRDCSSFDLQSAHFSGIEDLEQEINAYEESWSFYETFTTSLQGLREENWLTFRNKLYVFDDYLTEWSEKAKLRNKDNVTIYVISELDKYRDIFPSLKNVRGDALTPEHWSELYRMVGITKGTSITDLTLGTWLSVADAIVKNAHQIKELNSRAQGEVTIREALQELKAWAAANEYAFSEFLEGGAPINLIKDWKDLMSNVSDNQSLVMSLKDSPYYKGFADDAGTWEVKLGNLMDYLGRLNNAQRRWLYLVPIFGKGLFPGEGARFERIDREFRNMMEYVYNQKRVISLVDYTDVKDLLVMINDQLERCQKALSEFLETKRSSFPRFYFIGDDDLLEILGQAANPVVIQSHLKKLFQGINSVDFSSDKKSIIAMKSSVGEVVQLQNPVQVSDRVEEWLSKLAAEMKNTLKHLLVKCLQVQDINAFPSQILCCAEEVHFTERAEFAIQKGKLKELKAELQEQLQKLVQYDAAGNNVNYLKVKALILDIIHDMDVIDQLMKNNVDSLNHWMWQKQARFYMDDHQNCKIRMYDALFNYTYEYQGNPAKLVHTPLTDKCYLTLTQAMNNGYGGNPYGPAGTGKTESVKALGLLFARQVLVFNCDEAIDFKSMGRILIGVVKCGAWGCFDEFNRLDEEVLSAVSQQIQAIQTAFKNKHPTMELLGSNLNVDHDAAVFVTLNPPGKKYGGRSKLPDNLKQLFRAVAMTLPDLDQISEVMMYSEGFVNAREVGTKMVAVFRLCKQLLSPQQHYDWGLRPLKTILNSAGQLLQARKKRGEEIDLNTELRTVVQALRINTLSKLTFADVRTFNGLISDVFPGTSVEEVSYDELEAAIKSTLDERKLMHMDIQKSKILQFYEACNQRMGVVIVGPGGSGKSTIWSVLRESLMKLKKKVVTHAMNPKSIPRQKLLGYMDMDTREWFDGVLTKASRTVVKEPAEIHSWIICDGDIDPEWVESLNSVLDDNRLLTMPSGERIQFYTNVNFIFETHSLRWASPATVSRMGTIFLADEDMDTQAQISSWLIRQPEEARDKVQKLIESYFNKAVEWVLNDNSMITETTKAGLVMSGLSTLQKVTTKGEFCTGLVRGLGSNLDVERRTAFAKEVYSWAGENPGKNLLQCYYDAKSLSYRSYEGMNESIDIKYHEVINEPVVPTSDVRANADIVLSWISTNDPIIIVGPEGCGKNMLLRYCFNQLRSTSVGTLHCNSQTTAAHVVQKLSQLCSLHTSAKGKVYRPKEGDKSILYLKDINLPKPDKYDTIQLISFLQQLITYEGFYDDELEWIGLERVQLICSMNPSTTVGRYPLTTRFTALMRILYIVYPSRQHLQTIYSSYLDAVLSVIPDNGTWKVKANRQKLATTMVDIYEQVKSRFPQDEYSHYITTPRDITKWVHGLMRYDLNSCDIIDVISYESQRLFRDKGVDNNARQRYDKIAEPIFKGQWSAKYTTAQFFTTFGSTTVGADGLKQLYRVEPEDFKDFVNKGIIVYERDVKELHMLIFGEILEHIAHVDRVLSSPGGSLLLVGKPGVGRRTSVQLACSINGSKLITPNIGKGYGLKQFKIDLKNVLQSAGIEGVSTVFMLEDHQFMLPEFVEYVNSLLSSGEVPGLYAAEELEGILSPLKTLASEEGFVGGLFAFFVSRIKQNLHVVLEFDPRNESFQIRCESNPAFYNKCNIQWWDAWGPEGMGLVPIMSLKAMLQDLPKKEETVKNIMRIHDSCVNSGATSRHFITLLETYKKIYEQKRQQSIDQQSRLQTGLSKLSEAAIVVDSLSRDAEEKKVLLAEKQDLANKALGEITKSMELASEQKKEIKVLTEKLAEEAIAMNTSKVEIEGKLSNIQPILDAARAAVGSIRSDNLVELKSLKTPPQAVRDVLMGVLALMGYQDNSWNGMKAFLGKSGVKDNILAFDARAITTEIRQQVEAILKANANSYEDAVIAKSSKAAAPLAAWVKANVQYSSVLESIGPLEKSLAKLVKNLQTSQKKVDKLQEDLGKLDAKVASLTNEFSRMTTEAAELKLELTKAEDTLNAAQSLFSKLGGEKSRWEATVNAISLELEALPANALLAAAYTTYLSAATEDLRRDKVIEWSRLVGLPENWSYKGFMSTESELLILKAEGLPADDLSMENAIMILQSIPVSFVIDPSTQAAEWLKNHLKNNKLDVTTQEDEKFSTTLELAVRFGKTLVIQEVDKIHPVLYPLLRRDLLRQGPRWVIQIGDKTTDYHDDFKLFLVTRNADPIIPPDAAALITLVNFTTTRSGLEGQLLGLTIRNEKPELETKKSQLLLTEEEQKVQVAELEKQLLVELASSTGNLLENKTLIESLNETKSKSMVIAQSLKESKELQIFLDKEREVYRKIAVMGSGLFFVISDLSKINHMYQYSLPVFLKLFQKAFTRENGDNNTNVEQRLNQICDKLQKSIFQYVSRSIFKEDRLMFGLHLVHVMYPQAFGEQQWELLVGKIVAGIGSSAADFPTWASADRKPFYTLLSNSQPKLTASANFKDSEAWSTWAASVSAETEFPKKYAGKISGFEKLLIIQALRPDRLETAMNLFVCEMIKLPTLAPQPFNFQKVYQDESSPDEPLLLIISPGADPSQELEDFAAKSIGRDKLFQVAMGQGQAEIALAALRKGGKEGCWVLLKNMHLAISWLPTLEKELNSMTPHPDFRLWLTSEPHLRFSTILLKSSLKITFESPPGIKKNLLRTYEGWTPEFIAKGSTLRAQSLFTLAWFHAVIQERRAFVPQGWSKFYEFSFADLRGCAELLDNACANNVPTLDWAPLHGLFENAIYGGRIDNDYDMRVLRTYLQFFFTGEVIGKQASRKLTKTITLPENPRHDDYLKIIHDLSDIDAPHLFQLPSNIDRALQKTNSTKVINSLKVLTSVGGTGMRFNREKWNQELGPMIQLWQKLTESNKNIVEGKISMKPDVPPVEGFVYLENQACHNLCKKVNGILSNIQKVIAGTTMLTPAIATAGQQLLTGTVPMSWLDEWEGPEDAFSWLRGLAERAIAQDKWVERVNNDTLLKTPMDLGELFRPETLINALRQQTARALGVSLDQLKLVSGPDAKSLGNCKLPIVVSNLQLQGCGFEGGRLSESSSDGPSLVTIPSYSIGWILNKEPDPFPPANTVNVAVYYTSNRERLISEFMFPCSGDKAKWILTGIGVSLFE